MKNRMSRILLFVLILFSTLLSIMPPCGAGSLTGTKIILDPGHGGQAGKTYNGLPGDPGALGPTGVREADCTLAIALQVRDMLAAQGATVYMTRDADAFVSLPARTSMANALAVDRFVSIHQNASSSASANYTGSHVYLTASATSLDLAGKTVTEEDLYHQSGVVSTNCNLRGVHKDNFHVVRESLMPAELIENSFVTNPGEESKLKTAKHIQGCADAIFKGLMKHFGKTVSQDHEAPVISHSPVSSVLEATSVNITATVTDASGVDNVVLYYRRKGSAILVSETMTRTPGEVYTASIAASSIGAAGVEYYIEARDKSGNLGRLPAGSPVAPFIIAVTPVARPGSLTGVVTDKVTSARLAGVEVTINPGGAKVMTSATGVYLFENLAPGMYTVTGKGNGYFPTSASAQVAASTLKWNSFALAAAPPAPVAGVISGTVNVSATLTLRELNLTRTGTTFDFPKLEPGTYHLKAEADDYKSQTRTITLKPGKSSQANFLLLSPDKGILKVKVKQINEKGKLVNAQGVSVSIAGPLAKNAPTGWGNSSGEAIFDNLDPGTYTVSALGMSQTVTIVKGKTTSSTLSP